MQGENKKSKKIISKIFLCLAIILGYVYLFAGFIFVVSCFCFYWLKTRPSFKVDPFIIQDFPILLLFLFLYAAINHLLIRLFIPLKVIIVFETLLLITICLSGIFL